eukprot:scaffold5903_cov165-Ochromonas_danica.AAC.7
MSEWNETKQILQELEHLFSREDDVKDILDIKKMEREIEAHSAAQRQEAKDIIKVMTGAVTKKEVEITAPTQTEHAATLRKLSDKENIVAQSEQLKQTLQQKKEKIAKAQNNTAALLERANEYTLSATMADSRTAYAISLYSKISNITWNYNAPPNHLSGWISNESKKEMIPFDIDMRVTSSPFDVANELWDLIGQTLLP